MEGTAIQQIAPIPGDRRRVVRAHIEGLVASGALRRGSRVPSILELTRALAVAKNTVVAALDELCGEGVLEARERQGFFVRSVTRRERARRTRLADLEIDRVAHGMASILVQANGDDDFVPIGSGTTSETLLATPEWSATLRGTPPRDPRLSLRYADPKGEPMLREVIAARAGADVHADRVLITFGAVEGLNLTFAVAAEASGCRRVGIESPGYFMVPPLLEALGLEPVEIPRTQAGLDLERLRRELKGGLAAVMVNPNHQNPVGSSLSLSQRFELAKLADEHRFFVVEDDVYRGLWTEVEEPTTIHSLIPERTLFVNSFSKTLGPALRIGFVIAPEALLARLRRRKFLQTLSGDAYTQNLVAEFVDRRGYQRHLGEMREELGRRARIARVQSAPFGDLGAFSGAYAGGLFWRFDFAEGIDSWALYQAARAENVLVSPGCFFRPEHRHTPEQLRADAWMRVNVSRCEGSDLTQMLTTLRPLARHART